MRREIALAACAAGCASSPRSPVDPDPARVMRASEGANILLLLADDLGRQQLTSYGEYGNQPPTPNIGALAASGVRFENMFAMSVCSPARASLLTGRYPSRYGIGNRIDADAEDIQLPLAEVTIPEMLAQGSPYGYSTALLGKWHLASYTTPGVAHHPLDQGFGWFEGTIENLGSSTIDHPTEYYHWERDTNGVLDLVDRYATSETVDAALRQIRKLPEPWFVEVAFHAPHEPQVYPPPDLHHYPPLDCVAQAPLCYQAQIEALDTEIGRLLGSIDPAVRDRTTILLLADNPPNREYIQPPFDPDRGKGTLYDGGLMVPLIVAGPTVAHPGSVSDGLVSIVDVFATIADLAGVDLGAVSGADGAPLVTDSVSFAEQIRDPAAPRPRERAFVFAEQFRNGPPPYQGHGRQIRSERAKLYLFEDQSALFAVREGALDEGEDLFDGRYPPQGVLDDYLELDAALERLTGTLSYEGP